MDRTIRRHSDAYVRRILCRFLLALTQSKPRQVRLAQTRLSNTDGVTVRLIFHFRLSFPPLRAPLHSLCEIIRFQGWRQMDTIDEIDQVMSPCNYI